MMVRILTLLFAVGLVVSCGLEHPQRAVSSKPNRRSVADIFGDQYVHGNTNVSQCLPDSQLAFDVNATLQESTRLNRRYFDCPKPEPGVPCFYFKDLFHPFFAIRSNVSGELERFLGSYTFKVVGGGPYSRNNVRYYSEEEILKINSFNYSESSEESVWTLQNDSANMTKEGFMVMSGSINWVRWVCQRNSPCGDVTPQGLQSPDFFFIVEVSNRGVGTYCEHSARFELHVHGLPLLPDRALFYVGMTMISIFSVLCFYLCCGPRQHTLYSTDHDSLSEEEDESRDQFQVDGSSVKCWWTRVEQIYDLIFNFTQNPLFTSFILFVVVLDTTLLITQAFPRVSVRGGWVFSAVDACFLGIYLMEFFLKLLAWGHKYFLNSWNNMDFIIIVMSVVDFALPLAQTTKLAGGKQTSSVFRALKIMKGARAIRAFRLLKAIRSFHTLQIILATAVKSLRSIGSTSFIMLMVICMFTIFLRVLYSESDPERFGGIFSTITTLFQVLTLDDWGLVYNTSYDKGAAHIMVFLVLYIVVENLILLNIILAVLVDNLGLTINRTNQKVEAAQEDEGEFIRKIELEISETQSGEEADQEALKQRFSGQKHSKRKVELMTNYLRLLASMEQSQFSVESEAFLLNKLVEISFKDMEEESANNL